MGTIKINCLPFPGEKITIIDSTIFIDGEPVDPRVVIPRNDEIPRMQITGNVESIKSNLSVAVIGNVGRVEAGGSVTCDIIHGSPTARGSITCDEIMGNATAGSSITCDSIGAIELPED